MHDGKLHGSCKSLCVYDGITCMQGHNVYTRELMHTRELVHTRALRLSVGITSMRGHYVCAMVLRVCEGISACKDITCVQRHYVYAKALRVCEGITCMRRDYVYAKGLRMCKGITCM